MRKGFLAALALLIGSTVAHAQQWPTYGYQQWPANGYSQYSGYGYQQYQQYPTYGYRQLPANGYPQYSGYGYQQYQQYPGYSQGYYNTTPRPAYYPGYQQQQQQWTPQQVQVNSALVYPRAGYAIPNYQQGSTAQSAYSPVPPPRVVTLPQTVSQTVPEPLPTGPETAAPSTITREPSNASPSESFCGGACCGACDRNDLLVPPREPSFCQPACKPECFWLTGSFLMAWAKPSPLVPLVTTGFAGVGGIGGDAVPGGLGQPSTAILYGQGSVNFNLIPGFQIGGGLWLDQCNKFSVEASGFYLPLVHQNFATRSDPNGNPVISRPVINPNTGQEDVYVVALPGLVAGDISVANSLTMWGAELNGVYHMPVGRHFKFEALAGVRYINLVETLNISEDLVPLVGAGGSGLTFLGNTVDPPNTISTQDFFRTTNQFYGMQLGGGMKWECDRFFVDVYGKAAVGVNQQSVQINGISILGDGSGNVVATAPGGILAVPSNMGNHTRSVVTVVPQGGLTAGINVTSWLRLLAGYSFLYMDNVVRPASHLDRVVSAGQVPTDANFGATAGPMRPTFTFHEDGFWVNMFNIGVELHF